MRIFIVRLLTLLLSAKMVFGGDPAELFQAGRFQEAAEELQNRLAQLDLIEIKTNDDRLEIAQTKLALGMSLQALGEIEKAISEIEEVIASYTSLEAEPSLIAQGLDLLARLQQQSGDLAAAEATFRDSLGWRERDHSADAAYWKGVTSDHLGLLLLTTGDYQSAGQILTESLESTPPEETALLAQRHHYLARYLHSIRNYHRAAEHAQKSLDFGREVEGLDLASYLDSLALSLYRGGDQRGAEAALLEALEILRSQPINLQRARGEAEILNKVGEFALNEEAKLALSSFQEALEGLLEWLPGDDPSLAVYHNNIGLAAMKMGNHSLAEENFKRALALLEGQIEGLELGHQRRAEWKQNLAWNALLSGDSDKTRTLVRDACQEAEAVLHHLLEKGTELERLNFLAHFDLYSLPASAGEGELLHHLLSSNKGRLMDNLISRNSLEPLLPLNQEIFPEDTLLIDFVRYRKATLKGWAYCYGCVVETDDEAPYFVALGEERVLLRWLNVVSERLSYRSLVISNQEVEPPVLRLGAALEQLHKHFLAPVLESLPESPKNLVICPDGALHFLPFACLLDVEGNFLANNHRQVLFVSSRRDLFIQKKKTDLQKGRWDLFGISEFGLDPDESEEPWLFESLSDLPHVGEELKALAKLAPQGSRQILNPPNPEQELKNLASGATVLHLATHAFFREAESEIFMSDLDAHPEILLRSGLALSQPVGNEDGILYPHEITRLSLQEAQLVTLSACQTGLGTPLAGEGVLGLRRAFALAGARSLLLTLWQVPDQSTADFMSDFYKEAQRTQNPSFALWHLQGKLLARDAGSRKDDAALEEAVLRHGPFLITHQGPVPTAPKQSIELVEKPKVFWWRYLLWILVFGSLIALLGWISTGRKQQQ